MDLYRSDKLTWFRTGILLVLAALALNALLSFRELRKLVQNNQWVVHTLQVISELDASLSSVTDAENCQRGFLVTGEAVYLEHYRQAVAAAGRHVQQIETLTSDNSYQQSRIPELEQLVQERLQVSQRTIDLQQQGGHEEAREIVAGNLGKQKMDQLRDLVADMRSHEEALLTQRTSASHRSIRAATIAFAAAWLAAVIFVLAFAFRARREVQERTRTARATREREAWLRTTLRSIGDAVIATDAAGRVTFVNYVAEKLIACSSADCKGRPLSEIFKIFNEITGEPAVSPVDAVIKNSAICGLANHTVLRNLRGEETPIEDSAAPIFDENGTVAGVVLVFRDVGRQRKVQEIARTSEKLAVTGRLAATIAHEINNPLEAAINLLYLAQNSSSPEEVKQHIVSADHELSRMAHVTRKTLAFHRSSSVASSTNVCSLLEEVIEIYDGRIASQHINVEVQCPRDLTFTTVKGDLVQITSNLIVNALDALHPGGHLRIYVAGEDGGVRMEFEDDGTGITSEHLDKVFEPFFTTKKDTGTGLGLWVVKDLIDKLGGTISVASSAEDAEQGTCFSLFLPSLRKDIASSQETKVG